jgi:hypothetical protein
MEILDESNFIVYAAKHYDNPHCFDDIEFFDDLKRFKYLKKLLKKYKETGVIRERLILNHIIIIYNLFGATAATRMLFLKMDGFYPELKTFLIFLNFMPERVMNIGITNKTVHSVEIPLDQNLINLLRKI